MHTASMLIQTDPEVKAEAQKTVEELGFSLNSVLNAYLKQLVKTRTVNFNAQELNEIPNEHTRALMIKAEANQKAGKGSPLFTSDKALLKKNPKKYQHIDTMEHWLSK